MDTAQTLTMHHNYFANMEARGVLARHGKLHAYNNFFYDVKQAGIECSDSASCYISNNAFNIETPVAVYRLENEDGTPDESTLGFVKMDGNMFGLGGEDLAGDANGYELDYMVLVEIPDAELAVRVRNESGPR